MSELVMRQSDGRDGRPCHDVAATPRGGPNAPRAGRHSGASLAMIDGDDDDVGSTKKKNPVSVSALTGQGANNAAQR